MNEFMDMARIVLSVEASAKSNASLLGPEQWAGYAVTAIWAVLGLGVSYFILKRLLFKPVMKLLNQRKESVVTELANAADKTSQALLLQKEADKQIQDAKEQAAEIVNTARERAQKQTQSMLQASQKEAQEIREKAVSDAKQTRESMLDQMRDEVAELAVGIAGKVVGNMMDETRQKEMSKRITDESWDIRGEDA